VSGKKCQWYKVVSFTPSVKGEQVSIEDVKQSQDPNAFEPNPVVERRMRFRAVPIAPTDVDSKVDMDDADDMEHIILTEAQVRAVRLYCISTICIKLAQTKTYTSPETLTHNQSGNGSWGPPPSTSAEKLKC
jgi:hypothetical protein